jgi:hypothetical protein
LIALRAMMAVVPDLALNGLIAAYVERIEDVRGPDLSYRDDAKVPLPPEGLRDLTRYLLLAVCIDVGVDSWDVRVLLAELSQRLREGHGRDDGLFGLNPYDDELVLEEIERQQRRKRLGGWQAKREVPRILTEANAFAEGPADGDLDAWASNFATPGEIVEQIAHGIHYQGRGSSEARKKAWVWLRWMVRPAPDLRRWDHLDPAGLIVPVDRHVGRFAAAIGLISQARANQPTAVEARTITAWAAELFPDDPAKVDYALYLWGRGRSNQRQPTPDTCYTTLKQAGQRCPLAGTALRCGARCRD